MIKPPVAQNVSALVTALRSGDLPLLAYLDQLERHFAAVEPALHAFVPEDGRFDRLRRESEALLARYPDPESRPPLFGLPIGVKDVFHVDGFVTRAGSRLPADLFHGAEAESVARLRDAGVLILGKTVTTEFAYFAPGPTRNPHHPDHTPGGSSSGSAAAVAAGLTPLALGTQTIGSITRPAAFCGVVGFKPSYDRVSRAGVVPFSASLDHVGVFVPDVSGVELAAGLLCRAWHIVLTERKPVLGVPEGPYLARASAESLAHFHQACRRLANAGYQLRRVSAMADFDDIVARHHLIAAAEAAQVHAAWFDRYGELYHPQTADLIHRGRAVRPKELAQALTGREKLRNELTVLMAETGIDLWLSPAAPGPAPRGLDSTGDPVMNLPWTHSGLPTLNLPAGTADGRLPLGLQVAGRWYADEVLLEWAIEMEAMLRP